MDVNYAPLKIKVSVDDQTLIVRNGDIEKQGDSEAPKYASLLGKLKKQISFEMRGKCVQSMLMNPSLPKFSIHDNMAAGKVTDSPRIRKCKHSGSFNPRKVAIVFSALSSLGTIVLIFLTLRA